LSARPLSQISGALPVVGEAVELATGGAGGRTGEGFKKKLSGKEWKEQGISPLPCLFYFVLFPPLPRSSM